MSWFFGAPRYTAHAPGVTIAINDAAGMTWATHVQRQPPGLVALRFGVDLGFSPKQADALAQAVSHLVDGLGVQGEKVMPA